MSFEDSMNVQTGGAAKPVHPIPITSATATIPATTTDSATGTDTTRITGSTLGSITSPLRDQGIGMDFICARNLLDRLGI
ncbi:MAG: hypothetical protein E2O37_02405 [Proteobacteria bacterium]|nr:MAG: hypothetical protein E2O37_02405 [Pseudomonadota bacterium]